MQKCYSITSHFNSSTIMNNNDESITSNVYLNVNRSPLQSAMQQQTIKFLAKFHERKRQKLG